MVTAVTDDNLSHGAFRLLRVLRGVRTTTDGRGRTLRRAGQGYLASRCGHVTKRTLRRYLAELETRGRVVKVPHRRRFIDGRWYSVECQAYRLPDPVDNPVENRVSAGHTKRTSVSGHPFGVGARGHHGAPPRVSDHAHHPPGDPCGHGDPGGAARCPLCRRGIPAYQG